MVVGSEDAAHREDFVVFGDGNTLNVSGGPAILPVTGRIINPKF